MIDGRPPIRNPDAACALDAAIEKLLKADNPYGQLLAITNGVESLEHVGDDGSGADRLRDAAINDHGIAPADVQMAIDQGVERARMARSTRRISGGGHRYPFTRPDPIDYANDDLVDLDDDIRLASDAAPYTPPRQQELRNRNREHRENGNGKLGEDRGDQAKPDADDGFIAYWYGEVAVEESRPWLVRGTIPEVGCGILAGQWGTYKTFAAKDLAGAVMTATAIFGSEIDRRGGVLFFAAEGESEVPIRIKAAFEKRCRDMAEPPIDQIRAPFAWLTPEKMPLCLLDPKSVAEFVERARRIDAEMQARFNLPLALIIIDTVVATAGYRKSGDENDAVIGKRIMRDGLAAIARGTRTFALGVDHFGKDAETATRGASSKEDNADTVLAALGTKDITGVVTNPQLVVRKVRGGVAGRKYPFSTRVVEIGKETTLVIDWAKPKDEANPRRTADGWGTGVGLSTLRRALVNADPKTATKLQPWPDGPQIPAFPVEAMKREFYASYPAKGETTESRKEATRKAWDHTVGLAVERNLIGYRTINDAEWIWLGGKPQSPEEPTP